MPDKILYTLVRPALFSLDPEAAHNLTLPMLRRAAALGLTGAFRKPRPDPRTVMGITFPNPVGLAAGLDKDGAYIDGLAALGVKCEATPDGLIIDGGPMAGGEVHAHGDHRIAMAFSVAALRAAAPIRIHDCANVATSFPNFLTLCAQVGIRVAQEAQL